MIQISAINPNLESIGAALNGQWGKSDKDGITYVVLGKIVFVSGDIKKCPLYENVKTWHTDSKGGWGIIE